LGDGPGGGRHRAAGARPRHADGRRRAQSAGGDGVLHRARTRVQPASERDRRSRRRGHALGARGERVRSQRGPAADEDGRGALAGALGRGRRSIDRTPRAVIGYGASFALIAAVVLLRWFVIPEWSLAHPYLLFYPAIIAA